MEKDKIIGENLNIEDLLEHFQSMYSGKIDTQTINDGIQINETTDPDLDSDISLEELKQATFHQKNNSSYGLDNICSEAIKSSFDITSPFLLK